MLYRAFFCLRHSRACFCSRLRTNLPRHILRHTHHFFCARLHFLRPLATLLATLFCARVKFAIPTSQATQARHAFFCLLACATFSATHQIPCHTLSRAFLRHARHAFFIFIILNFARVLKILLIFLRFFCARFYFLKFAFFSLNSACIF